MSLGAAETFGIALMATWGAAGAVALGRSVAKSPAMREFAAGCPKMNLASKCALVAGLVGAVAIGGTKPTGTDAPTARPPGGRFAETSRPAPPFALVEVRMNGVAFRVESASAVEIEDWRKHGSSSGGVWLNFEEPVFRIGTNSVSRAHVAANGVLRTPTRFAIEWKNASGLSPNADTDGDGLSDWDEFFLQGTDPRRTDTDGDGLADGAEVSVGLPPSTYDADDDGLVDGIDPHPLDYDGYAIAAGTTEVNRKSSEFLDGRCGYSMPQE